MADAKRDQNNVPTLIAVSSSDGSTPVNVYADPTTHRLLTSDSATGGAVGGASNLTTVGAIPYVTSAGVLGQDPTALFWDATNDRLGVGTGTPGSKFEVQNTVNTKSSQIVNSGSATGVAGLNIYSNVIHTGTSGNSLLAVEVQNASTTGTAFYVQQAGTGLSAAFNGGNVVIGNSPVNGNYKLDIQASGSTGTLRVYDQTAVTGSTKAVIQAGASQSGPLLSLRTNAGVETLYATSAGELGQKQATVDKWYLNYPNFDFASGGTFRWSSTTDAFGTIDLGLARNSAGVLEINNGTAGTLRDLYLRSMRMDADYQVYWNGRSQLKSAADGTIHLLNNAGTDFSRLQFGGTTSSFPSLKRSTTALQVKLADDSAFTQLTALRTQTNTVAVSALPAASAGLAGSIQAVSDALAPAWGVTVAGGGAAYALVTCNGAAWTVIGI